MTSDSWDDNQLDDCDMPESHPDGCACIRHGELSAPFVDELEALCARLVVPSDMLQTTAGSSYAAAEVQQEYARGVFARALGKPIELETHTVATIEEPGKPPLHVVVVAKQAGQKIDPETIARLRESMTRKNDMSEVVVEPFELTPTEAATVGKPSSIDVIGPGMARPVVISIDPRFTIPNVASNALPSDGGDNEGNEP